LGGDAARRGRCFTDRKCRSNSEPRISATGILDMENSGALHLVLAEWRRLVEAEGQAIRSGNWPFVTQCQAALATLRATIDELTISARSKDSCPVKAPHRSTVLELIELQRRNLATLQQRRDKLSSHIESLARTGRNLRGIQRSYAPAGPAAWSSYS